MGNHLSNRVIRGRLIGAAVASALAAAPPAWAEDFSAGSVASGDWFSGSTWSSNPMVPNNGQPAAGDTWNATLNGHAVTANQKVTLDTFTFADVAGGDFDGSGDVDVVD